MTSGNWRLFVCGSTHKRSTLEQREPFQLSREELARANRLLAEQPAVMESLIVSTCNRVEFYFVTDRQTDPFDIVAGFYREFRKLDVRPMADLFRIRKGIEAADHIFRVAAGIESMVIGENQIMGQLKEAYSSACAVKTAGKVLHRLFHQAFRVGKEVRSDTEMGKGACSVSSAAMDLLQTKLSDISQPTVLFVGSNRMISLAANQMAGVDHARLVFANRTPEKAVALAEQYKSEGFGLENLVGLLAQADIVVSCTSATEPVITRLAIETALARRDGRKLIVMDLAVPRDVDFPKHHSATIDVYDLDDIQQFVQGQQQRREQAIPQAEQIIECKRSEFAYWLERVMQEHLYNGHAGTYEAIREEELEAVLDKVPAELREELTKASRRLVERVVQIAAKQTPRHHH